MKKALCILLLVLALTGCSSEREKVFLGEFADLRLTTLASFHRSYLMMDCCEEWKDLTEYIHTLKGISSVECFEYYLYDEDGEVMPLDTEDVLVLFHPTMDFKGRTGDISVYSFKTGKRYDASMTRNGDIEFHTDTDGVFVVTRDGDTPLWISNVRCTGQCKTCSDDW